MFLNKLLDENYVDMNKYLYPKFNKIEWFNLFKKSNSKYSDLFKKKSLTMANILLFFKDSKFQEDNISLLEAEGITLCIFKYAYENRKKIFEEIISIKKKDIVINVKNGIYYFPHKVNLKFISSLNDLTRHLNREKCSSTNVFYRGQSNVNYLLKPSIYRNDALIKNEYNLFNEILRECPEDFAQCKNNIEKLVKMQHYGIPTRLLDVSLNPLVALYFACVNKEEKFGELVMLCADSSKIKYPQSDNVSVLASLPYFKFEEQQKLIDTSGGANEEIFQRLCRAVRLEKFDFENKIKKETILDYFFILAPKNNRRIASQDGAFIICGLENKEYSLNDYRYMEDDKKVILIIRKKNEILKMLENYCINKAKLFPEIETVSQYLKNKYS